eukprot:gene11518-15431_t
MERYQGIIDTYGESNFSKIWHSKVLVIGAGGIGCEILKNLALAGFRYIELIDLDTIDVSNLNRQFLFRPEHVGQPKAVVAAQATKHFNPDIEIIPYHSNIKDAQFNVDFYAKFDIILNALDNVDARRHVNRLCLASNMPLLDSGTTGYAGQVVPIIKGETSCYDCVPKQAPKVYPICTIRSTPTEPVHCIVWAKECFKLLFGNRKESMLYEDEDALRLANAQDESNGDEKLDESQFSSLYMHLLEFPPGHDITSIANYGKEIIKAMYNVEVQKKIEMDVYKTAKIKPQPLDIFLIETATQNAIDLILNSSIDYDQLLLNRNQANSVMSLEDSIIDILLTFFTLVKKNEVAMIGQFAFEKDDHWCMKFITAATNLRSTVFGIKTLSYHDIKGIAGNIIPAIATTNAIVASIQVLQAIKIITSQNYNVKSKEYYNNQMNTQPIKKIYDTNQLNGLGLLVRQVYVTRRSGGRSRCYLSAFNDVELPSPSCYVCGTSQLSLQIDVFESTLEEMVTKVIKKKLGFNTPTIMIDSSSVYEEGEGADDDLKDNLKLKLANCPCGGIKDGSIIMVEDFTQELT